jgi:hypothetical protein
MMIIGSDRWGATLPEPGIQRPTPKHALIWPASEGYRIVPVVDGTCVFCNRSVAFILRHDRTGVFRFAHLQGRVAQAALARHGLAADIDTIYAVTDFRAPSERVHLDGGAVMRL